MYHSIVKAKIIGAFVGLNAGRIEAITGLLTADAEHYFVGTHALSGTRRTPAAIKQWYERLLRLLPGIQFDLKRVQSEGPPWRTLVIVEWSETNWGTDGVQTSAEGINIIQLRWGRVTSVHIYVDTERLVGTLKRIAQKGTEEAMASPIIS